MADLIDRQAAIDALAREWIDAVYFEEDDVCERKAIERVMGSLENLPSALPERLTYSEQRIFLAAMVREEKVCKKVDDEWEHAFPGVTSNFVRICKEIERKVKKTLWTN